jgi:hypothetical protein
MRGTMRDYLRRRYRLALIGVFSGALLLIAVPAGAVGVGLQIVGAVILGAALVIGLGTRCPKCRRVFERRVIAAVVQFSHAPPQRCPHCGVDLNAPP